MLVIMLAIGWYTRTSCRDAGSIMTRLDRDADRKASEVEANIYPGDQKIFHACCAAAAWRRLFLYLSLMISLIGFW